MRVGIVGVGLLSAGLEGWVEGARGAGGHAVRSDFDSLPDPDAALLPANERRRSTAGVRWALHVAQEAMAQSRLDPRDVATVFASSGGEMGVLDQLCRALATTERIISPTLFHQSVHNTAAGYWGIATSCQQSSTALSCYDDSCAAGLLEAATYATMEGCPVLFVSYDLPAPDPLIRARPIRVGLRHRISLDRVACRRDGERDCCIGVSRMRRGDGDVGQRARTAESGQSFRPLIAHASGAGGDRPGHHPHEYLGRPAAGHGGRTMTRLTKEEIGRLLPHGPSMCLLESVEVWDDLTISCRTTTHRDPR